MQPRRRGARGRVQARPPAGIIARRHGFRLDRQARGSARTLRLPDEEMPSGAGHDAAVFANAGIPSAMIFVRNEHGSHNPNEAMEIADFAAGVAVMREALK